MKPGAPLGVAVAALLVAIAAWLGLDLDALRGPANQPQPAPGVEEQGDPSPSPTASRPPGAKPDAPPAVPLGAFDYYVLSLSWSPTYCATEAQERDRLQCKGQRPFAFVVHGLWPQNETGYPEDCPTDTPRVPDALVDDLLDIMPSRGLIGHEWRSHGACTGLSQEDYFAALRHAYESVVIPAAYQDMDKTLSVAPQEIARDFQAANEGVLTPKSLVVTCGGGTHLDEVRICLSKDMRPRDCGRQTQRAQCRRDTVIMPPVRSTAP